MCTNIVILILSCRDESVGCTSGISIESHNCLGYIVSSIKFEDSVCSLSTDGCLADSSRSSISHFNETECVCKTGLDGDVGDTESCEGSRQTRVCDGHIEFDFVSVGDTSSSVVC